MDDSISPVVSLRRSGIAVSQFIGRPIFARLPPDRRGGERDRHDLPKFDRHGFVIAITPLEKRLTTLPGQANPLIAVGMQMKCVGVFLHPDARAPDLVLFHQVAIQAMRRATGLPPSLSRPRARVMAYTANVRT